MRWMISLTLLSLLSPFRFISIDSSWAMDNGEAFPSSLYQTSDPLISLDNTNFDQLLLHSPEQAYVVEFYMSWCGHCRHFAPTYVRFGHDIASKRVFTSIN